MKEQLLNLIEQAELLRAKMEVEGLYQVIALSNIIDELYWLYHIMVKYE